MAGNHCDATGRKNISPISKVITALRISCSCVPADYINKTIQVGESTALEFLKDFCSSVISGFNGWKWRAFTKAECGIEVGKDKVQTLRMEVLCDLDLLI